MFRERKGGKRDVRDFVVLVDKLQLRADVVQLLLLLVLGLELLLQVQLALVQPGELVNLRLVLAADLDLGTSGLFVLPAELCVCASLLANVSKARQLDGGEGGRCCY